MGTKLCARKAFESWKEWPERDILLVHFCCAQLLAFPEVDVFYLSSIFFFGGEMSLIWVSCPKSQRPWKCRKFSANLQHKTCNQNLFWTIAVFTNSENFFSIFICARINSKLFLQFYNWLLQLLWKRRVFYNAILRRYSAQAFLMETPLGLTWKRSTSWSFFCARKTSFMRDTLANFTLGTQKSNFANSWRDEWIRVNC